MDNIEFTVAEDERFPGRQILIGTIPGRAPVYASFVGRQEKAEDAIRARLARKGA